MASGYRDTDAVNVIQLRTLEETVTNKVEGIESGMHYLSVNKKGTNIGSEIGSAKVTELIERRKNYDQYIRYKTQQLQLKARQAWQGEKFNEASLTEINNKVAELEADPVIAREAAALKNYTVTATVPSGKDAAQAYKDLVNALEVINANLKSDAKYTALADGNDIEALKLETNYSNEGGKGLDSLAIGFRASAGKDATEALAVGYKAKANGVEAVALGSQSAASGQRAVALGADTVASGSDAIAIGGKGDTVTTASGISSIAIGNGAKTNSNYSVGLGGNVQVKGDTSIAIGDRTLTTASRATAVGPAAKGLGTNSVALGASAETGFLSKTETNGDKTYTGANYSTAIGGGATVYSNYSVAIGNGATVGETVTTSGVTSLKTDAPASVVLGSSSKSLAEGGTVLGADATATFKNSVALGRNVTTTASAGAGYLTNQAFADSGKVISVGQRRINQLADGKADDDAVTVAQLKKLEEKTLTTANAKITIAPDQNGTQEFAMGSTINLTTADSWGQGDNRFVGDNIETYKKNDGSILIGVKENPKFKTLKLNNGNSGSQDLTLSADNAGNLNVGSKKITGVANGTENNDAVNYSQLNTVKSTADTAKTTAEAAKGTAEAAKTKAADVETKLTQLGDKQLTFAANSGTNIARKLGETIGIKGDNSTISTSTNATSNEITIKVKDKGIGTTQLADKAVTEAKLADNAVTTGKIKDGAVTGAKLADKTIEAGKLSDALNNKINNADKVASNKIRLTGDSNSKTSDVLLNKENGIEFAINGKSGEIVTKASGTKVEIGLDSTIKAKLDKLSNDPNATYATKTEIADKADKTLGNITGDGENVIKEQARKAVVVEAGNGIEVKTTKDDTNHTTKYTVKINDTTMAKIGTGTVAKDNANTVTGGTVNDYLTKNYLTKTNVTGTVKAADGSSITVKKGTDDANGKEYTIDVTRSDITGTGITVTNGEKAVLGNKGVTLSIADGAISKAKLDDELKNIVNGISSKASTLNIGSGSKEETVNLLSDRVKINGSGDVTVSLNNKEFTVELSEAAKKKLDNVSAKSDGRDKKDSTAQGNENSSGNKGLTKEDKLNGKDLTDKVNALRNGEAGTVVFTDKDGNRLVKANDGKYYKTNEVNSDGSLIGTPTAVDKPELRVVNADGSTTTANKLSNIANGKIGTDSKDAINGSQIKDVLDKLGVETDANGSPVTPVITGLTKADGTPDTAKTTLKDGLNAVIGKVNEGIKYKGDLGEEGKQQLGTVFNVNAATGNLNKETEPTVKYVGSNLITKYSKNDDGSGKLEIGFKESPTFKDVTADKVAAKEVDADKAKVKGDLTFDDGTGKPTTIVAGDGKGSLLINGKKVATSESAPVLYTDATGNVVEKALDGKIYKVADLEGKRFDPKTRKYYDNNQFVDGVLKENPTVADLREVPATEVKHALAKLDDNAVTGGSVLSNVAAGTADTDAVNVKQLNALKTNTIELAGNTGSTDKQELGKEHGLSFGIKGADGITTAANGTDVTVKLDATYKSKLDNLDANANTKYANKDATNIGDDEAAKWREKLGLSTAVLGTVSLGLEAENKQGTTTTAAGNGSVNLSQNQKLKITGQDEVVVKAENQRFTVELSEAAKKKLDNVSAKSDGRDKKDSTAQGNENSSGNKGLTKEDKLNGKDLTDKVNALRNGEAGTVVFTDKDGNRLVKANDGKYYKPEFVSATGETQPNKAGEQPVAVDNPELRTVNSDGKTTTPIVLNNIASALGLDGKKPATSGAAAEDYGKPISETDAKEVMKTLLGKNTDLNKAVTLRDLQAVAQAGLDFTGNAGSTHRALGTTLKIVGKDQGNDFNETKFNETYTTDNVATNVKTDGTVEIGFKKSPTFDDVKAKNIEALNGKFENLKVKEKIETKEIIFKTATGNNVTIATGKDGNLYINGVAVPTAESAPVIYTDTNGNRVEKGQDGKIYKPRDLEHLTYVSVPAKGTEGEADYQPDKSGYYTDAAFETEEVDGKQVFKHDKDGNKILKANAVAEDLSGKAYTGEVVHNLSPLDKDPNNPQNVNDPQNTKTPKSSRLVNVAAGVNNTDAVNVGQLNAVKETPIKFKGDTDNDVVERKLGDTLNITGDGVKVTKNATGDGLVLSIDKGKVQTKNVADQAVTSAKLAQDTRTVVYVDANNNPVELGADNKLYRTADLSGKTYIEVKDSTGNIDATKTGYYANEDVNADGTLKATKGGVAGQPAPTKLVDQPTAVNPITTPLRHALNGYVAGGTDVTTKSILTNVGDGISDNDAVNVSQLNKVKNNTIKLTGDGNTSTDKQELGKEHGLSFGIKGKANEIVTTANGTDVTLKLSKEVTDKLKNITAASDGKDGKTGATGNTGATGAMGEKGLTGQDGLNGKDLTTKANALRDGEAGTVVFTDKDGNRLVKAKDGKYYKTNEVNPDGSLIGTPTAVDKPELRTVNSDGTTTKPVTLNNVASALGLDSTTTEKITPENAKTKVGNLLDETNKNNLNKVATARDLQAVAQAGLDFKANAGSTHRALGTALNIIGKDVEAGFDATKFANDFSTENVATNVKEDGTIQIGISKKVKFEEVDGGKVTAGEVVLKPADKTKPEVKLTADEEGNLKVGDKTITAGPIKLALGGKTVAANGAETTSGGAEEDKVNLSAGEKLNVIGKDGVTVNVSGKDITLGLDKATTDKLKNITAVSDGKDGKDAKDGTNGANGTHGLTAKDGLNGKDLTTKVNALRNGEAGTVVFTDKDGNRLVKANDGKYYKPEFVSATGETQPNKAGEQPVAVDNPELRTVNSDGTTTKPVTLNNIASALEAVREPNKAVTPEKAQEAVKGLLDKTTGLDKAVNLADLQAVAQAGLDFTGNSGKAHAPLSTTVNIAGQGTPAADFAGASGNIKVVASEDATNKISKLEIQLAEALKDIKSIQNDKTKITLDENDGVKVDGKDGGKVVVNGKDGNSTVAINGGDGTNGSSVSVNGKDGKDGVTIKGTDGTNGSSIVVNGKDGKPGVTINGGNGTDGATVTFGKKNDGTGTGSITGLKDPDGTDKTAAATVNYVTNEINNVTNNINNAVDKMNKGLNFVGNDNAKVNAKLDGTVSITGEGTVTGTTAANNIKVEKDTTADKTGLVVKLADKLTEMKGFETKEEDGKKVTINKDGISLTTTGTPGANLKLGTDGTITGVVAKPDDDTSVATVGYIKDKIKTSAGLTLKGDTTNIVNNNSTTNNVQNLGSTLEVKAASEKITAAVKEEKDGKIVAKEGETTTYTGKNLTTTYTLDGKTGTGTISVAMTERPEFEKVTVGTGNKKMTLDGTAGSIEFAKSNPTKEVYADNNGNIIKYKDENGEIKVIERNVGTGSVTGLKDVETVTVDGEKIAIDRTQAATAGYVDEKVADVKNEVRTIVNQVDKNAQRIEEVNKQAKEGIASVAAMATLDFNDAPVGRVGVGAAIGGYRGTQAVAVGAVYGINESFKVNAKMGIPTSRPNGATYGVSATYYFDR